MAGVFSATPGPIYCLYGSGVTGIGGSQGCLPGCRLILAAFCCWHAAGVGQPFSMSPCPSPHEGLCHLPLAQVDKVTHRARSYQRLGQQHVQERPASSSFSSSSSSCFSGIKQQYVPVTAGCCR